MNIHPSSLSLCLSDLNLRPLSSCDLEKKATELSKYKILSDPHLGNLSCLPNELITRIFNYLGAQACKNLSLVSAHIFSLVGMQLPKVTFLDLSQPITQLSAPELIENVKISSAEELEKGLNLGIDLEKIISCNCENFPSSLELAHTIEIMPSLKQLKLTIEQFTFLLREETFAKREAFYLSCLSQDGELLKFCPEEVKDNKPLVLAAIKNNQSSFQYASENLRNDLEVALAAFTDKSCHIIEICMGEDLKSNRQFFLKTIPIDPWIFRAASKELKNDPEIVFALLRNKGVYLCGKKIGEDLKKDKEFFLKAIPIDPWIFRAASKELKNDPEIVFALLRNKGAYLCRKKIGEDLKSNRQFFLKAIPIDPWIFKAASEELKNDPEIALAVLAKGGSYYLQYIGDELKDNVEFFIQAQKINPHAFCYASTRVQKDIRIFIVTLNSSFSGFILKLSKFASWLGRIWQKGWDWINATFKK